MSRILNELIFLSNNLFKQLSLTLSHQRKVAAIVRQAGEKACPLNCIQTMKTNLVNHLGQVLFGTDISLRICLS